MVRIVWGVFALLLLGTPLSARAADRSIPLLAVLEFDSPEKSVPPDELQLLTDAVRGAVVKELAGKFKVLTRETMTELVPPERLNCFVDKCAAEIGRMLQAPYVIAGTLRPLKSKWVLTLEAYASTTGELLGSDQLRAADIEALLDVIDERGRSLVREWLSSRASTPTPPEPPKPVAAPTPPAPPPSPPIAPPPVIVPPPLITPPPPVVTAPAAPKPVAPPEKTVPTGSTPGARPSFAVRAGLGGHVGVMGAGVEWRPSWWGIALGTGNHQWSGGLTFGPRANAGGPYVDLQLVRIAPGLFGSITEAGTTVGATAGWDFRLARIVTVKAGIGAVYNAVDPTRFLTVDLCAGVVF